MKKLTLILAVAGCGAGPAAGIEDGLLPVDLQVQQFVPQQRPGVLVLPIDAGCRHVLVERCELFTDGTEQCTVTDGGCI